MLRLSCSKTGYPCSIVKSRGSSRRLTILREKQIRSLLLNGITRTDTQLRSEQKGKKRRGSKDNKLRSFKQDCNRGLNRRSNQEVDSKLLKKGPTKLRSRGL